MKSAIDWIVIDKEKPVPWQWIIVIDKHWNCFPLFVERFTELDDILYWTAMPDVSGLLVRTNMADKKELY